MGITPAEVREMPCEDFDNLVNFYEWKHEQEQEAIKKAKKKSKRG